MTLIGFTGPHGAGKRTAVEYLETKGFVHFYVSDYLSEQAAERGWEPNRVCRAKVANEIRKEHPQALMQAVLDWGRQKHPEAKKIVLEPQYTAAECSFIREHGGVMLALECDLMTRYHRSKARDPEDKDMSFEEFRSRQYWEMGGEDPDAQNLKAAIACADEAIDNSGTIEDLQRKLDAILQERKML